MHINKCPILARKNVIAGKCNQIEIDRILFAKFARNCVNLRDIRDKVIEIFHDEREVIHSDNVETELYNQFFSNNDKNNMTICVNYLGKLKTT